MSISTDGFGTIVAGLELGGGGGTVIPAGGTIAGVVNGNLLCEGSVTLTGSLEVNGSMLVRGGFTNNGGYEVTIRGDLHAKEIFFDRANKSLPQSNFTVDGDLIFTLMEFNQCGGEAAQLRVGGDLIGSSGYSGSWIEGDGETNGTPGLNILVYGDMTVAGLDLSGYSADEGTAGNGGTCYVYGTANIWNSVSARGGDCGNGDCGNGGSLEVWGDLSAGYAYILLAGGAAYSEFSGHAGNGGQLYVGGNATVDELEVYGGSCGSNNAGYRSGTGGEVDVDGNLTVNSYMNISGGDRYGTLSESGGGTYHPNGGDLYVDGDLIVDGDFAGWGGSIETVAYAPHNAGNGANVYVRGNLVCSDDFRAYGGYCNFANGGSGGYLRVEGNLTVDDELEFQAGNSSGGTAGDALSMDVYGNANIGYMDFKGGFGGGASGGSGGFVEVRGVLFIQEWASVSGGPCDSNNENHRAGNGGYLGCYGLLANDTDVYLYGGDRYGNTTVTANNWSANGGQLFCQGSAQGNIWASGGSVYTSYPNAPGGQGGNIFIFGDYRGNSITAQGGGSVGANAGQGGDIRIGGMATFASCYADGGSADNSSGVGGDAATNGPGGKVWFESGVSAGTVSVTDGDGPGTAPTVWCHVRLNGNCAIWYLDMTNRADSWIYQYGSKPVTLRVAEMPNKATLNDEFGNATDNISTFLANSIFLSGPTSTWSKITGTSIMPT